MNPAYKGGVVADPAWFHNRYVGLGFTLREVACAAGCSLRTAARWAKVHKVPLRTGAAALKSRAGKKNANWRGGTPCEVCGTPRSYDARRCALCDQTDRAGARNANYKGLADVVALVRAHARRHWRPAVLARHVTCARCTETRGLHAHHIVPLRALIAQALVGVDLSTATARLAAVRQLVQDPRVMTVENGVALCRRHHEEVHEGAWRAEYPVEVAA